jgi:hypothetical protein
MRLLCTAATLAEGISVLSNEPVEQPSCIAEGKPLSQCSNEPGGREQTRQTCDCIPPNKDSAFGSDHVQLPQAFIQVEPGIDR